jgi:hypothetical protein
VEKMRGRNSKYLQAFRLDVPTYREIIEKHTYCFESKYDPEYIIDAGANVGMATIYFA